MTMKEMSAGQLVEKFEIALTPEGTQIKVARGKSLYPAAIQILKDRKAEIINYLTEMEEEGFGSHGYDADEDIERDWDAEAQAERTKWAEDDAYRATHPLKPAVKVQ